MEVSFYQITSVPATNRTGSKSSSTSYTFGTLRFDGSPSSSNTVQDNLVGCSPPRVTASATITINYTQLS